MNDAEVDSHTLPSFLRLRVAESPAAIAFWQEADHTGWDPITWKEFELRVARLRDALHAAGLRKGERLALIAPVSLEWELVHHAALAMGAVVVGIDAHDLPTRIAILAEQADVAGFVTSDARTLASVLPQRLARVRFVLDLGSGEEIPAGVRGFNWAEFNALANSATSQPARPTADDLATIISRRARPVTREESPIAIGRFAWPSTRSATCSALSINEAACFAGCPCRISSSAWSISLGCERARRRTCWAIHAGY